MSRRQLPPDLNARDVYGAAGVFHGPVTFGGRAPLDWPYRVGVVPRRAVDRQPRLADQELAAAVAGGETAVPCLVAAGLGGVGKTQLAANLAEQLWQDRRVDLLMWVTAVSRTEVVAGYAQAAADVLGVDDPDPAGGARRWLSWLAGTDKRWLIVLDDVAEPADLVGLWPPDTNPHGCTVVTTRRRDAALLAGRRLVDVAVFTEVEAVEYLHGRLGDRPDRLDQAGGLAADLGYLPLALAQAAAYIVDQDLTCAGFRARLAARPLADLYPDLLPDDQLWPVAQTWALSMEVADIATGGVASTILRLAAVLDPNGIPAGLFTTAAAAEYYQQAACREMDVDAAADAVRAFHRFGLADVSNGLLRMHALLQRTIREATEESRRQAIAVTAADALLELWPAVERGPDTSRLGRLLRANTAILTTTAGPLLWNTTTSVRRAHPVLFRAGTSLGEIGLVGAARDHYQRLHRSATGLLGPDHPDTLHARNNLASWRGQAGDPAGAVAGFGQLLDDALRVLGPDHPATLTARGNLAGWRGAAGDTAGAVAAFGQLLDDALRVLGPDHPATLTARGNLARWRGEAGDPAGAAALCEQLLVDRVRVLGPNHPATLTSRHNLAWWRGEAGDPSGAVVAFGELLDDSLRVLGVDHPDTLATRHNLAWWRGEAGDPSGAVVAFGRLLDDSLRVLGVDHPDTLATRHNLAWWRGEAGDSPGAVAAFERLLDDALQAVGADHPITLATRGNLARRRGAAGEPVGRVRVLGANHPAT